MSVAAVETVDLAKTYPKVEALRGLSLRIEPGEIFALLGPNGAGKTTWISIVCGLVRPTGGARQRPRARRGARRAGGAAPGGPGAAGGELRSVLHPARGAALSDGLLRRAAGRHAASTRCCAALDLSAKADTNTRALSGGMKRRLLIAKALVPRPRVAFLDEPTAGVDVALRHDLVVLRPDPARRRGRPSCSPRIISKRRRRWPIAWRSSTRARWSGSTRRRRWCGSWGASRFASGWPRPGPTARRRCRSRCAGAAPRSIRSGRR